MGNGPRGSGRGKDRRARQTQLTSHVPILSGVVWRHGEWQVRITLKNKQHHFGPCATEKDAAKLFDKAVKALAENPVLNFREDGRLNPDRKRNVGSHTMR